MQPDQRHSGEEQRTDSLGPSGRQTDRDPPAEGVPDHERWLFELIEDDRDPLGVALCPEHLLRRWRCPKTREIRGESRYFPETLLEICATTTPSMERENAWIAFTEGLGEQGTFCK